MATFGDLESSVEPLGIKVEDEHVVVVIGAGSSGISAARTIKASKSSKEIRVILLEAKDRIGGRVCETNLLQNLKNVSHDRSPKVKVQLGANWIHGLISNPIFLVAQELGLTLHQTSSDEEPGDDVLLFDCAEYNSDICAHDSTSVEDMHRSMKTDNDKDRDIGAKGDTKRALSMLPVVPDSTYKEAQLYWNWINNWVEEYDPKPKRVDNISFQEAFRAAIEESKKIFPTAISPEVRRCLNWFLSRVQIALATHDLSESTSLRCYTAGESDGQDGEALVEGGYYQIIKHLAEEHPLDIRYEHIVKRITKRNYDKIPNNLATASYRKPLSVVCSDGQAIDCDRCILTVPIGVLLQDSEEQGGVTFSPTIPMQVTQLCRDYGSGLMNIVWLWYPTFFWPQGKGYHFFGITSPLSPKHDSDPDSVEKVLSPKFTTFLAPPNMCDQYGNPQPILMCQVVGEYAKMVERMDSREVAEEASAVLRSLYFPSKSVPIRVPDAIGCIHSKWGQDPFAYGSWSFIKRKPPKEESKEKEKEKEKKILTRPEQIALTEKTEKNGSISTDDSSSDSSEDGDDDSSEDLENVDEVWGSLLYCAGEAMSLVNRGTVHGAYASGEREATRLLASLSQ